MFFEVDWSYDEDDDGYPRSAYVEWDADTYLDSALVKVIGYGRALSGGEHLLFTFGPYWIWGYQWDVWSVHFSVPFKDLWSLRLVLTNEFGDSLDAWPEQYNPSMVNVPMESKLNDLHYVIEHYPWVRPYLDNDGDNYSQVGQLVLWTWVEPYDTADGLGVSLRMYGRDSVGSELFLGESGTFFVEPGQSEGWESGIVSGHHGPWDFRLELINPFGEVAAHYAYDQSAELTNVPMELGIEDPPITVVFDPNPVNTLDDTSLADLGDWMYAVSPAAYRAVTLQGLNPPQSGYYWLTGQFVRIVEDSGAPYNPLARAPAALGPIFPYLRSDEEFEQLMCYYHIDRSQRYLQSLGFDSACNYQISVDAHGLADVDNSQYTFYISQPGRGWLLFGDGGVDDGEDADMIVHEYGHAIQDNQAPGIHLLGHGSRGRGNESRAMAEGFGYYWTGSATDSASVASGFPSGWCAEWNARGLVPPMPYLYTVENGMTYPDSIRDTTNWHQNGMIWGGALWDIFQQFGKRIADSLALRSHEIMRASGQTDPTFHDGAEKILVADVQGYQGAHAAGIRELFVDRGILEPCNCGSTATLKLWADCNCDGAINAVDLVRMVNYVYKGWVNELVNCPGVIYPNIPPPGPNPNPTCSRKLGDVNWDGSVNVVDVVRYVNFVYKSQTNQFCNNPCLSPDCL